MKKFFLMSVCAVVLLSLFSCNGDKESPLIFKEEYVSNSDNIILEYYSPDPHCGIPKLYYVTANKFAGELELKCENADVIAIKNHRDEVMNEYVSVEGGWKAEVINSNTIKFTFDQVTLTPEGDSSVAYEGFNVVSLDQKDEHRGGFNILRLTDSSDPLR